MKDDGIDRTDPSNPAYYKATIVGLLKSAKKHGLTISLKDGPSGAKLNFQNEKGSSDVRIIEKREGA